MDNGLGKVGYSVTRTISDNNYGSYKISSWCEQSYQTEEEKKQVEQKIHDDCMMVVHQDVVKIKSSIERVK